MLAMVYYYYYYYYYCCCCCCYCCYYYYYYYNTLWRKGRNDRIGPFHAAMEVLRLEEGLHGGCNSQHRAVKSCEDEPDLESRAQETRNAQKRSCRNMVHA